MLQSQMNKTLSVTLFNASRMVGHVLLTFTKFWDWIENGRHSLVRPVDDRQRGSEYRNGRGND